MPLFPPYRSRGLATSPYASATALSPTLLVPLKYAATSADGQILYEDNSATDPVEVTGDPAGGVKWDGSIVATSSTDAERPVWQGNATGTKFDGTDDVLVGSESTGWLPESSDFTAVVVASFDTTGGARSLLAQYTGFTAGRTSLLTNNTDSLRWAYENGGLTVGLGGNTDVICEIRRDATTDYLRVSDMSGTLIDSASGSRRGDLLQKATEVGGSDLDYHDGAISVVVIYHRAITASERSTLYDALGDL